EDDRHGQHDPGEDRDLDLNPERAADGREVELFVARGKRGAKDVEDRLRQEESDDRAQDDRCNDDDEAAAELLEVLKERHRRFIATHGRLTGWAGWKRRSNRQREAYLVSTDDEPLVASVGPASGGGV